MLPIAFLGLVAEGALKGFEQYGWLRLTEVGGNVLYVAAVYALVWEGAPFEWIAYSYLAVTVAKYLVLAGVVSRAASVTSLRVCSWTAVNRRHVLHRCWLMLNNRIAGILQQPLVPLAIGALFGPAEVGTYDLITRLPRFLKTTMAPLHSAILPISTQSMKRRTRAGCKYWAATGWSCREPSSFPSWSWWRFFRTRYSRCGLAHSMPTNGPGSPSRC